MMGVLSKLLKRVSYGRYEVGLIMLDLDHFKHLNDTYGHDAGDHVLSMVGLFLKGHARPNDVVCRFGGEEFVLILSGVTWPKFWNVEPVNYVAGLHYLNLKVGETPIANYDIGWICDRPRARQNARNAD
jgi:diguanylate cyclase (GGDEF)-like protein